MAADVSVSSNASNPCCAELRSNYEEKKAALNQAYNLLTRQTKVIEKERKKTELEKEAKEKEIVTRKTLQDEIHQLKAQVASLSQEAKNLPGADKSGDELKRVKQLLEEEKKRTISEKMNATNAWNLLQIEKGKVEEERRLVKNEQARANELSASVEKIKHQLEESRVQLAKKAEEEKQKATREKRRADAEKCKLEERNKYAEELKKKAIEEKSRANNLLKKLEEERQRAKDLLKNLEEERKANKSLKEKLAVSTQKQKGGVSVEKKDLNVKILKQKLKLRKAQLKHVKKILKFEKSESNVIKQEFSLLKQDFIQISSRFRVLDAHLNIGGTSDFGKVFLTHAKPAVPFRATTDCNAFLRQGGAQHMSRESQSKPVSGTSSESLLPNRQNMTFNSDKKLLVGPQERERGASVSSPPLLQNQKNTDTCTKSTLEALNHKRKRKESLNPMKKVKIQSVENYLNSDLVEFEKVVREDGVLKLLEFENEELEKKFRSAMDGFLSPNLPQIPPRGNVEAPYKVDVDKLEGKDEDKHSIPQYDLRSKQNLMEIVGADGGRHERSQYLSENEKTLKGGNEKHSHCFLIVFSKLSEKNVPKIGRIWRVISGEDSGVSQTDLSARVLQLASNSELIPEDKMYAICSLLASDICRVLMSYSVGAANFCLDKYISSIVEETCSVLSEETLHFLKENNLLENITFLLEDFLIFKQVHVYKNGDLCSTISTKSQYISSCILFALICSETNRLDIARGTAYKILLNGKSDTSYALISTHIIASICGEILSGNNDERLLQHALRWVVNHIERDWAQDLEFMPCQQCPFQLEGAVADGFVDSLLDQLEDCSSLKNQDSHFVCGEHCSTCIDETNGLCYFTEIVSLLELVGSYMVWECAYNKVVPRLWKALELCGNEELAASILVLIGHLSRSVLDEGSYNHIQVRKLRDKLSNFVQTKDKIGLALQFACISALLNLIPLNFKQILEKDGISSDKAQFCSEIYQIKNWFSGLSEEQKDAFQSLFIC